MASDPSPSSRSRADERGAALVEFAILLPVLMALILGMFSGGLAYNRKITMTDAVREGARYGATLLLDDVTIQAQRDGWADKVKLRVAQLSAGELSEAQPGQICAVLVLSTGTSPASNSNCNIADPANSSGEWVARVRAQRGARLEAFFFSRDLTLNSTAVAFYERVDS